MTRLLVPLILFGTAGSLWADEPKATLSEARKLLQRGNVAEARQQYEELAKVEKSRAAATIGVARCWQAEGDYRKALRILDEGMKGTEDAGSAELLAARAELLYFTGRWDDALEDVATVLKTKKDHFLARWVKAQIVRDKGDLTAADTEMRWFVRTYTQRSNNDDDIKDPNQLLIVGKAGAEDGRLKSITSKFSFILHWA